MRAGAQRYRIFGALLAVAVSMQATGVLPLVASAPASRTCCHHDKNRVCRCPMCTHARELGSDQRFIRTCGATTDPGVIVIHVSPALAQAGAEPQPSATAAFPIPLVLLDAPFPDRDVPTPPPLG